MSRYIATAAIRGAHNIVNEADAMWKAAMAKHGPDTPVQFTNTAYFLPTIYAYLGHKVETLKDMEYPLKEAKSMLAPVPTDKLWLPYLGETLDAGVATLFAEEMIEGVRFVEGQQPEKGPNGFIYNGPIDDIQLRAWGIQLVDGRMPGFAGIVGRAKSNEVAVKIVRELQQRGILIFLAGKVGEKGIVDQLLEEGVELGYNTFTVPFGSDTISAIYALGFAARSALTFGGFKAGQAKDVLLYNKNRVFAFVLALGEVDDLKYATAAGAITYGFPTIADTNIPNILPTGVTTYEHVVSMPFDDIPGADDMERVDKLLQRCIEVRGVKVKVAKMPIPVAYGSAFEGERIRKDILAYEFGNKGVCFEYLESKPMDEVEDNKITVIGPDLPDFPATGTNIPLGIHVQVAGRKMQQDFEPVLERQFHYFINGAEGVQHMGQRDITWIRLSKAAAGKGFSARHFGDILYAKLHADFGAIVDKVQVTLYTERDKVLEMREKARAAFQERNTRAASLTDESVDTFYSCTLCQSFAPTHVCVINPERVGLCGAYNWLDCKASYEINPTGPNQPIAKKDTISTETGEWGSFNDFVYQNTGRSIERMTLYSIMDAPMTSCGCFECIMMVIPEANGVMIVSREDPSMTPAGMTFSTLAGMAGGGMQTPGLMGHGKFFLTSKKFISKEGGIKRVVWLSSVLKESMKDDLQGVFEREGCPDLLDKIADASIATTVDELLAHLESTGHPALTMDPIM
ncbi:MAG: CO dehydrogenase/CO-methylating acetyl-CoA synthase complex subunit beta [Chloroflexota bacterium]|nr:MAG: CO dehydrogenase/CO-methylating acetyl-CoA synthase complex subunit beta [Chloroflexota bacterium]